MFRVAAARHISAFIVPAVDITVYHNGFHGDLNETFFVGDVDEEAKKLVQTTYECLMQAIDSGRNERPPAARCTFVTPSVFAASCEGRTPDNVGACVRMTSLQRWI